LANRADQQAIQIGGAATQAGRQAVGNVGDNGTPRQAALDAVMHR
jgi:hypothetical protein